VFFCVFFSSPTWNNFNKQILKVVVGSCCVGVACTCRSLNRRVLELEANVNDLTEVQQQMSSDENAVSAEARKRLNDQLERTQKLESSLQKSQQQVDELDNKMQVIMLVSPALQAVLDVACCYRCRNCHGLHVLAP